MARAEVELVMARSHRDAYLLYLGRALRDDRAAVARELGVLGRIIASKARLRLLRSLARSVGR
jgi:hypothetical protein